MRLEATETNGDYSDLLPQQLSSAPFPSNQDASYNTAHSPTAATTPAANPGKALPAAPVYVGNSGAV